ncbi:sigma-70 family RNA polymerase sigma factor [Actinocrispum wychmicini]|uniref:RNA polymerase sigma-70 factor (ECF subfamily) n=1 Tax=Actinocrispum wychmicini TaxID=1213861 RepID=A0A4R2IL49_9PSEU|nr:sigma-70 family RNA polymerase sigma factor [Actinocrispum wychmicini]TCO45831.1 RNA polymerase sigma-70 factor (ECF subfamily) [Actinocrispum wychmicini]
MELTDQFEANRARLRAMAYRMLGSPSEADDAVQEAWIRVSGSDPAEVRNMAGWLTTVVGRVCLDMLRSRTSRREDPLDGYQPDGDGAVDPQDEVLLADSVGLALLVVLETLAPAERLAFVLHDMFGVPFDEIGPIVGRSSTAARQLASRARRRVRTANAVPDADLGRQREIVDAFLAASRHGDFDSLLALLDPDVVLRADETAVTMGAAAAVRGARPVAEVFHGRAKAAKLALVNGVPAVVWGPAGRPKVVFAFTISGDLIAGIRMIADQDRLRGMDVNQV